MSVDGESKLINWLIAIVLYAIKGRVTYDIFLISMPRLISRNVQLFDIDPLVRLPSFQACDPTVRKGFKRLAAVFRGNLTRDLFGTEKVSQIIRTVKVSSRYLLTSCFIQTLYGLMWKSTAQTFRFTFVNSES